MFGKKEAPERSKNQNYSSQTQFHFILSLHFILAISHTTVNWQHQTMSENSTGIIRALAANKLSEVLADELKARKMIGHAVYACATNRGPDSTEYTRMKHLITALMTSTESNPQCYYDFITILQLDGICEHAEAALKLLSTGMH